MTLLLMLLVQAGDEGGRPVNVPNAMAAHTWFIILAVGAFLAWSISFSLQLQKESAKRRKGREEVSKRQEELLDRIAGLEDEREAGEIADRKYKEELKELKFQLSKILEKTGHAARREG